MSDGFSNKFEFETQICASREHQARILIATQRKSVGIPEKRGTYRQRQVPKA